MESDGHTSAQTSRRECVVKSGISISVSVCVVGKELVCKVAVVDGMSRLCSVRKIERLWEGERKGASEVSEGSVDLWRCVDW